MIAHFVGLFAALDWDAWLLLGSLAGLGYVLWQCQRNPTDAFDLRHLITNTETGKLDRFAFAYMAGLPFVAWFFVNYTVSGRMTEMYAALCVVYWAAPKSIEAWMAARRPV